MGRQGTVYHLAGTLALFGVLAGTPPLSAQESSPSSQAGAAADQSRAEIPAGSQSLPDSPGAVRSSSSDKKIRADDSIALLERAGEQAQDQPQDQPEDQPQDQPAAAGQSQSAEPQKPVGTAAAEGSNVSAIAASQPAGVAIAPAKQHRVRTIILRTGAIVGAGIAIGAVVALTAATPPKPPGAH